MNVASDLVKFSLPCQPYGRRCARRDITNCAVDWGPGRFNGHKQACANDRGHKSCHVSSAASLKYRYEVRPRKDKRGFDLISDSLPFGRLWYGEPNAVSNAKFRSRSHDAVIRVYDDAGNVIETHEHAGEFKESLFRGQN
jgi:hypothetical protein